jgi:hypothetical protein
MVSKLEHRPGHKVTKEHHFTCISPLASYEGLWLLAKQLHSDSRRLEKLFPELVVESEEELKTREEEEDKGEDKGGKKKFVFHPSLQAAILRQYRDCKALYGPSELLTREELARLGVGRGAQAPLSKWCSEATELCGDKPALRQLSALAYTGKSARWAELEGPGLSEYLLKPRHGKDMQASIEAREFQEQFRTVTQWQSLDYFRHFLQLYSYARGLDRRDQEQQHRFVLLLSFLAFQGVPDKQLHILLTVASHQAHFADIDPPDPDDNVLFMEPHRNSFERRPILILAEEFCCDWEQYQSNMGVEPGKVATAERRRLTRMRAEFREERAKFNEEIADCVEEAFPEAPTRLSFKNKKIFTGDQTLLLEQIADVTSLWAQNKRLKDFWAQLEEALGDPAVTMPAVKMPPLLPWAELPSEIPATETAGGLGATRMCHGCQKKMCQCNRAMAGNNPFTAGLPAMALKHKELGDKYMRLSPDRCNALFKKALIEFKQGRTEQDLGPAGRGGEEAPRAKRARKEGDGDVSEALEKGGEDNVPPMPSTLLLGGQDALCMARASFDRENAESWRAHHAAKEAPDVEQLDEEELLNMLEQYTRVADTVWETVVERYLKPTEDDYAGRTLQHAGLWPTSHPPLVLQFLLPDRKAPQLQSADKLVETLGAYVILRQRAQRAARCLELLLGHKVVKLQRELDNMGHQRFKPAERPEWLLFEYENNLLIRPTQIQVAESMMAVILPHFAHSAMSSTPKTLTALPTLFLLLRPPCAGRRLDDHAAQYGRGQNHRHRPHAPVVPCGWRAVGAIDGAQVAVPHQCGGPHSQAGRNLWYARDHTY